MKAAGRPVSESRARPPCAAHGRRVARRGADDANLVVACVRDSHPSWKRTHACGAPEEGACAVECLCTWEAAARVQRQPPASVAVRRFCPGGHSAAGADASKHSTRAPAKLVVARATAYGATAANCRLAGSACVRRLAWRACG